MRNYLLIILRSFFIISCKKDLTGHWHTEFKNHPYKNNFASAIDIEKNNTCYYISSLSYSPSEGRYTPRRKKYVVILWKL